MRNSYILAKFIIQDEDIVIFPRQVQFYFEHKVRLPEENNQIHHLAFVRWFLPVQNNQIKFYCQIGNETESCNIELWKNNFYNYRRDSIIPVHHIYS